MSTRRFLKASHGSARDCAAQPLAPDVQSKLTMMTLSSSLRSGGLVRGLVAALTLVASAGCEELFPYDSFEDPPRPEVIDVDVTLAVVAPRGVKVEATQSAQGGPTLFTELDYGSKGRSPFNGARCERVAGLFAKLDGSDLPIASRGGWSPGSFPYCMSPTLRVSVPPTADGRKTLTIGDPSKMLAFDLGDALGLRTAAQLEAPAGGTAVGATVKVRWSHAADLDAKLPSFSLQSPGTITQVPVAAESRTRQGEVVSFPLPAGLVAGRPAILTISYSRDGVPCGEGCMLRKSYTVEVPIDVRAP